MRDWNFLLRILAYIKKEFYWLINTVSSIAFGYPRHTLNTALPTELCYKMVNLLVVSWVLTPNIWVGLHSWFHFHEWGNGTPNSRCSGNNSKRECLQVCENNVTNTIVISTPNIPPDTTRSSLMYITVRPTRFKHMTQYQGFQNIKLWRLQHIRRLEYLTR